MASAKYTLAVVSEISEWHFRHYFVEHASHQLNEFGIELRHGSNSRDCRENSARIGIRYAQMASHIVTWRLRSPDFERSTAGFVQNMTPFFLLRSKRKDNNNQ